MSQESDFKRLEQILEELLQLDADRQRSRIEEIAAEEPDLARELQRLVSASEFDDLRTLEGTELIERSADDEDRGRPSISRYRVLQRIGEGGFGTVWLAEQTEPVRRQVAIKVLKPGLDSGQILARFEAERQALALMDHPNIARVLDAGSDDLGRPFVVMELVRGVPIDQFCRDRDLDLEARITMARDVASAVQHAHTKGVIHRDLKPANILVGEVDGRPVPKVIDFGVAKAMQTPLTDRTLFTEFRQFVGTPEYMSPEQAELSIVDVDARSDVYSLGVLLYELVTGSPPFDPRTLRSAGFDEMRRIIREVEPPAPSTRVSATLASGGVEARQAHVVGRIGRLVRGELDWIILKAMAKARDRRYATAAELAADLGRLLDGDTVEAAPPSRIYRMRRFASRNRAGVLLASAVAMTTVSVAAASTFGWKAASDRSAALVVAEQAEQAKRSAAESRADELAAAVAARNAAVTRLQQDVAMRRASLAAENRTTDGNLARTYLDAIPSVDMPWLGKVLDRVVPRIQRETAPSGPEEAILGVAADRPEAVSIRTIDDSLWIVLHHGDGEVFELVPARIEVKAMIESMREGGTLVRLGLAGGPLAIDTRVIEPTDDRGPGILLLDPHSTERRYLEAPGGEVLDWAASPDGRTVAVMGTEGIVIGDIEGHRWSVGIRGDRKAFATFRVAVSDHGEVADACSGHPHILQDEGSNYHGWVRVYREGEELPTTPMVPRTTQEVVALAISDEIVAAMIEPANFVVTPFGAPQKMLATVHRAWDRHGLHGGNSVVTNLHPAESHRGLGLDQSHRMPFQRGSRLSISDGGGFIGVVRDGQVAELVDSRSGVMLSSFRIPAGAFAMEATEEGTIGIRILEDAADRKNRRWVGVDSESIRTTARRFDDRIRLADPRVMHVDPFGRGRLVFEEDTLSWVGQGRRIDLDPTAEMREALNDPTSHRVWSLTVDGEELVGAIMEGGLVGLASGEHLPFAESWDLATGERLVHQELLDGDDLFFPMTAVPAGDAVEIGVLTVDARNPRGSITGMNNAFNHGSITSVDFRSLRIGARPGPLVSRSRSGLVGGVLILDDGDSATLEIPIDGSPAVLRIVRHDAEDLELTLPLEFEAVDTTLAGGSASRLVPLDDGRSVGVLGDGLLMFDTEEWIQLGSIEPSVLGEGIQAGWDGIRTIGGGDAVELTGVDGAGRVVVTVPALESRPPAADPTS